MTFVKTTWIDDSDPALTAAQLNRIETGIGDAHSVMDATCLLTHSANQGGGNGAGATWTINFDTEADDPANMHAGSNDYVTVPYKGVYLVTYTAHAVNPVAAARYSASLQYSSDNGANYSQRGQQAVPTGNYEHGFATSVLCAASARLRISYFNSSGAVNGTIGGGLTGYSPWLGVKLLRLVP
jgi:hypothetical protein